jgi:hypothetical protein
MDAVLLGFKLDGSNELKMRQRSVLAKIEEPSALQQTPGSASDLSTTSVVGIMGFVDADAAVTASCTIEPGATMHLVFSRYRSTSAVQAATK